MGLIYGLAPTTPGLVFIQAGKLQKYYRFPVPPGWTVHIHEENLGFCGALRWFYKTYPELKWYGLLQDDDLPITAGWDSVLPKAAGDWKIAYADDGWAAARQMTGQQAFGGELVRTVGNLAPDFLWHRFIDNYWEKLASEFLLKVFCPEVKMKTRAWTKNHSAVLDSCYREGHQRDVGDYHAFKWWLKNIWPEERKILSLYLPGN